MQQFIVLHPAAPDKPVLGAPCNGCGACCAAEPCPVGILVFLRRRGACPALTWHDDTERYRCGLVDTPARYLTAIPAPWARILRPWLLRRISAGSGCDSDALLQDAS